MPAAQPVAPSAGSPSSMGVPAAASGQIPAAGGNLARKRQVMDHFLLALRSSELARIVDPGTLHYWLDSTFQDHTRGGSLQLQNLFGTLMAEPGVEARMLAPPLLALKCWESKVGMRVVLPPEFEVLTEIERKQHLVRFPVQIGDVDRLLGRVAVGLKAAPRAVAPEPVAPRGPKLSAGYADPAAAGRAAQQAPAKAKSKEKKQPKEAGSKMTKGQVIVAVVVSLLVFGGAGVSLYLTFSPVPVYELDPSIFSSTGVPVVAARRKGTVVVATVGPQFSSMPREAQTAACERALGVVSAKGATGIHLVDVRGNFLVSKTNLVQHLVR